MRTLFAVLVVSLLFCGCGRGTVSGPEDVKATQVDPDVLIRSFGDEPRTLTSVQLVRVGSYYDFSEYDTLRVSFSVARLSDDRPYDEVIVKIGPATSLQDTIRLQQANIVHVLNVSGIAKPSNCAFTFRTNDPLTVLSLSNLLVVGWRRN